MTIEITPTSRLTVEYEQGSPCPRGDWHMLTGFVKIPHRGDSRLMDVPAVHEPEFPIAEAYDRFDDDEDRVVRWAKIFHGRHIEYDSEHGGFWFVAGAGREPAPDLFIDNWPHLEVGTPEHLAKQAEVIAQERETYRQWAYGEVYIVSLERAYTLAPVEWNAADEVWELVSPLTEDMLQISWEEEDSLGDCYLDDDYTAQQVALACFNLTDDEAFALMPKPEVGDIADHRAGLLDPRKVAEVSENRRQVKLDIGGYVTDWLPSINYRFTKPVSA